MVLKTEATDNGDVQELGGSAEDAVRISAAGGAPLSASGCLACLIGMWSACYLDVCLGLGFDPR